MKMLVLGLVMVVVGCGPSAAEIKTAKQATYVGDPAEIFNVVQQTVGGSYKIADAGRDDDAFRLVTQEQWYNPEGGRQSPGQGGFVSLTDRSVMLQMIVDVVPMSASSVVVHVTPKTFQHISGSPKPRELAPDDPNLPGWVSGRVDTLHHDIYKSLQKYVAK